MNLIILFLSLFLCGDAAAHLSQPITGSPWRSDGAGGARIEGAVGIGI